MGEIWKPVTGYEDIYSVSNYGRVYSHIKNKILKSKSNGRGYLQTCLTKNKVQKMHYIHRLVADAFCENPNNFPEVNHKDENVQNNRADNLEWCTSHYNLRYGTRINRIMQHHKKSVKQLDMSGNIIEIFESLADAERLGGYNHSNVSNCCNGKLDTAYGYRWEFVSEV